MKGEKFRVDPQTGEMIPVLNSQGQEIPDPVPLAPPIGFIKHIPLHERIRAMVQHEHQRVLAEGGDPESPDEADDFVLPDEEDPRYGEKFAMMPGHEHEWEENYLPPKDFKDMHDRLVKAGWSPPKSDDPPAPARQASTPASWPAPSQQGADPARPGSDLPK